MARQSGIAGVHFTTLTDYQGTPTWTEIPRDDIEQDGTQWPQTETATKEALDGTDDDRGKKLVGALPLLDPDGSYIATLQGYAAARTRIVLRFSYDDGDTSYIGATAAADGPGLRIYFDVNEKASYNENPVYIMTFGCAAARSTIPVYKA